MPKRNNDAMEVARKYVASQNMDVEHDGYGAGRVNGYSRLNNSERLAFLKTEFQGHAVKLEDSFLAEINMLPLRCTNIGPVLDRYLDAANALESIYFERKSHLLPTTGTKTNHVEVMTVDSPEHAEPGVPTIGTTINRVAVMTVDSPENAPENAGPGVPTTGTTNKRVRFMTVDSPENSPENAVPGSQALLDERNGATAPAASKGHTVTSLFLSPSGSAGPSAEAKMPIFKATYMDQNAASTVDGVTQGAAAEESKDYEPEIFEGDADKDYTLVTEIKIVSISSWQGDKLIPIVRHCILKVQKHNTSAKRRMIVRTRYNGRVVFNVALSSDMNFHSYPLKTTKGGATIESVLFMGIVDQKVGAQKLVMKRYFKDTTSLEETLMAARG